MYIHALNDGLVNLLYLVQEALGNILHSNAVNHTSIE